MPRLAPGLPSLRRRLEDVLEKGGQAQSIANIVAVDRRDIDAVWVERGRRRVRLFEAADGQVEIRCADLLLPYTVLDKQPLVALRAVVENKRLGAVLSIIRAGQEERDQRRLASKKLTLRQKTHLRESRAKTNRTAEVIPSAPNSDRLAAAIAATQGSPECGTDMANFFANFEAEQKARRKRYNDASKQRKRDQGDIPTLQEWGHFYLGLTSRLPIIPIR